MNPQSLNRYSYCVNNPLKHNDPSGHDTIPSDYYPGNPDYFPWPDEDVPGLGLGSPPYDGALGYTQKDEWLLALNGRWVPITTNTADSLLSLYFNSTANNWTDFISVFLPDFSHITPNTPTSLWPTKVVAIGDTIWCWHLKLTWTRESCIKGKPDTQLELMQVQHITLESLMKEPEFIRQASPPIKIVSGAVITIWGGVGTGFTVVEGAWPLTPVFVGWTLIGAEILGQGMEEGFGCGWHVPILPNIP
jgi:hypothetical protein